MAEGLEKENEEAKKKDKGYDTCNCVWEMYKIIYNDDIDVKDGKNINISTCFDLEKCKKKYDNEGRERKYAPIKEENKKIIFGKDIELSGDVIFNFDNDLYSSCQYYIENDSIYNIRLKKCKEMNNSFENCALLLSDGNLQGAKKGIGNDRGDTFIWALNEYYKGNSEIVLNYALNQNGDRLRKFLNYFGDVYKYCEVFYNIKDRDLIDRLIKSGSKALDSAGKVENYIDLALEFWDERAESMKKIYRLYRYREEAIPKDVQKCEVFNTKRENVSNELNEKNVIDKTTRKTVIEVNDIDEIILEKNIKNCIINQTKETVEEYIDRVEGELEKKYNGTYEHSAVYKEKIIQNYIVIFHNMCTNENEYMEKFINKLPNREGNADYGSYQSCLKEQANNFAKDVINYKKINDGNEKEKIKSQLTFGKSNIRKQMDKDEKEIHNLKNSYTKQMLRKIEKFIHDEAMSQNQVKECIGNLKNNVKMFYKILDSETEWKQTECYKEVTKMETDKMNTSKVEISQPETPSSTPAES